MKVYISGYRNHWISPYTILERVLFWKDWENIEYETPWVQKWSNRLEPICVAIQKLWDLIHPKVDYVKIDRYDTWSMDHTLAKIILPMLKQLQATKHGSANVDLEDVPEELRTTSTAEYDTQYCFDSYHEGDTELNYQGIHTRWDWVLNEMIFAFEHLVDDSWEEQYRSGEIDWISEPCNWYENGKPSMYQMKEGPNHTYKCDYDAIQKVNDRMDNGFKLFGKYFRCLWD